MITYIFHFEIIQDPFDQTTFGITVCLFIPHVPPFFNIMYPCCPQADPHEFFTIQFPYSS